MSLIAPDAYNAVFEPLRNGRVGYLPLGDDAENALMTLGVLRLFDWFDIDYRLLNAGRLGWGNLAADFDWFVVSSAQPLVPKTFDGLLKKVQGHEVPVVILPVSIVAADIDLSAFHAVYPSEAHSAAIVEGTEMLVPDLCLAVASDLNCDAPIDDRGMLLRQDNHSGFPELASAGTDPNLVCDTAFDYLQLASQFAHIVTDRVPFAIAALNVGRRVTLVPGNNPINRSAYDSWLKQIGCEWQDEITALDIEQADSAAVTAIRSRATALLSRYRLVAPTGYVGSRGDDLDEGTLVVRNAEGKALATLVGYDARVWEGLGTGIRLDRLTSEIARNNPTSTPDRVEDAVLRLIKLEVCELEDPVLPRETRIGNWCNWVSVNPPVQLGDRVRVSATLFNSSYNTRETLWFETDAAHLPWMTDRADPYVLAFLFICMVKNRDLWIRETPVSANLIENLREYMAVWHCWYPELNRVRIHAEEIVDVTPDQSDRAIACFSGGVDSAHTLFRRLGSGPQSHPSSAKLEAVLMAHGFDIPWEDMAGFNTALARAERITEIAGLPLIKLRTNIRRFGIDWPRSHGLAAASALTLFSKHFGIGLIPGTFPYNMLAPWGSNALTDRFMGSAEFRIENDSPDCSRLEKFAELMDQPGVVDQLRVCWQEGFEATNCGKCMKCVLTGLMAITAGGSADFLGPGFDEDAAAASFDGVGIARADWMDCQALFREASRRGIDKPWVGALARARPV